jgi:hypothetical protein
MTQSPFLAYMSSMTLRELANRVAHQIEAHTNQLGASGDSVAPFFKERAQPYRRCGAPRCTRAPRQRARVETPCPHGDAPSPR